MFLKFNDQKLVIMVRKFKKRNFLPWFMIIFFLLMFLVIDLAALSLTQGTREFWSLLQHVGSSSLARDQICAPGVLITGPPGKSLVGDFFQP